ncbi:tRNA (adenosine(37)-N6)-threonylcarbamoyltransferase complex ATPase subunit type 1 TsaE [Lentibacillus cibarius]|uniref:tRNA threonylcarbamoyladenosine biosynthesis protein TsaE n=1 Tax=Lentibacillus cibarius TaxID=2583219 RepID=A0A549YHL6_9BACI|nr:tRNA (adenosine(37)-N6)-threonylcarbamoyltransferase complex ATPase subunit type 1 TsaE [Lentibacillus cibarius]TRM11380.1 tRNA (adenosine(37)-N6)-threonylcarbamoyltransferase complex ATPase subunit type 1 TsaE [Lentibacillus cibarius]
MDDYQITTHTDNETERLAEKLASLLKPGDVVTLEGDLGAGKTTFAKGIAHGLGVKRTVNSPTFTIIKEYEGELPFYHMDVYRLEDSDEDIGFDEYFNGDGVCVVEWAHFIKEHLPEAYLNITITYADEHTRVLTLSPGNAHFKSIAAELTG